jgi:hypothetical protein
MTPEELSVQHSIERAASGLSKDGQVIATTAVTMLCDYAAIIGDSTLETCGAEGPAIVELFMRQASEVLASLAGEGYKAGPCAGECGVAAHRDLVAIAPDGTRIRRETP